VPAVSRAIEQSTTLQWFRPSALRRLGWGERRIRDALIQAPPGHWRSYPQLEDGSVDFAADSTKIDYEADAVIITKVAVCGIDVAAWDERIGELELLLPVDAAGAPIAEPVASAPLDAVEVAAQQILAKESDPDPTPQQEMMFAIFGRELTGKGLPDPQRPTDWVSFVAKHWKDENDRRPTQKDYPVPHRDTVKAAVKLWRDRNARKRNSGR
jgi:hypothetical protein